jgi:hypothetical protein
MLLNIVTPHLSPIISCITAKCIRCCKSYKMKANYRTTRKQYFDIFIGPYFEIDTRYSEILTAIFICLLFSSGMPILYLILFFRCLITYWVDKILVFKFYRKPRFFDLGISRNFMVIIMIGLVIHYLISIWVYGHPSFISSTDKNVLDTLSDYIKNLFKVSSGIYEATIIARLTLPHNIICIIFVLFLILILIIRLTVFDILSLMCRNCYKKYINIDSKNLEIGLGKILLI